MRYLRASQRGIARFTLVAALLVLATGFLAGSPAFAHCDGLDGPVVGAARIALQTNNINHVLIWVRPQDADEIKRVFQETLAVRN